MQIETDLFCFVWTIVEPELLVWRIFRVRRVEAKDDILGPVYPLIDRRQVDWSLGALLLIYILCGLLASTVQGSLRQF